MVTTGSYRTNVTKLKCRENLPVSPGVTGWKQTFSLLAGLTGQKRRRGLALEGQIKHQKEALASTTVFQTSENDEGYGQLMYSTFKDRWSSIKRPRAQQVLVISYLVRVKIWLGVSTLSVKVPFLLMHPPEETKDNSNSGLK
ncbi:unnamed protein product [Dicrocoelium dendriticum]|nr:unnamed protein product [Dicrocoelium dendriticum]